MGCVSSRTKEQYISKLRSSMNMTSSPLGLYLTDEIKWFKFDWISPTEQDVEITAGLIRPKTSSH